jgi:hypothetical protein
MTNQEKVRRAYISGQWCALNIVLNLINTYEIRSVPKKIFFKDVFELRPVELPGDTYA